MRVIIADDHRIVREGLIWMLTDRPDIEIVGEAEGGESLLTLLDTVDADVILLDIRMPDLSGIEVLERLRSREKSPAVLVMSMHDEPGYVRKAVELGAAGYLLKNSSKDEMIRALESVAGGAFHVQGEVARPLIGGDQAGGHLSPRQRLVLQLVADGLENKQIAAELNISATTVKKYLSETFETLSVLSRAEAVAVGLRTGLIT